MRPRLPDADQLLPYLRRIDATRVYSNFGPLTTEFQDRLSDHLGLSRGCIAAASCGTTALISAILAAAGPATEKRPYALVPGFTFAATASAAERCGYRIYLADVDLADWTLDPQQLCSHPYIDRIGVVIPVAPFGRPVAQAAWRDFCERTGVPVVIDAAASFDCLGDSPMRFLGTVPAVLSFHATKSFGTGEGGCIICTQKALLERATEALNFGMYGSRDSRSASINGKLSEYHAAVGLAELDGWTAKQARWRATIQAYRQELLKWGILDYFFAWPNISLCYALFFCGGDGEADKVQQILQDEDIDFRFWYGAGLHHQTYFANCPRNSMEACEKLGRRLIGLPTAPDLTQEVTRRVAAALGRAVQKRAAS